jgi:hypothetical protein
MRLLFAVVLLSFGACSIPAAAADFPDVVRKAVDSAANECRESGGKPGTNAMATVADLDGNGGEDWILDYAKMQCSGIVPPFCGSGGCTLQIFLWQSGSEWELVFDQNVQAWSRAKIGGKPGLKVSLHGSACNRVGFKSCNKTYVFEKGRLRAQ